MQPKFFLRAYRKKIKLLPQQSSVAKILLEIPRFLNIFKRISIHDVNGFSEKFHIKQSTGCFFSSPLFLSVSNFQILKKLKNFLKWICELVNKFVNKLTNLETSWHICQFFEIYRNWKILKIEKLLSCNFIEKKKYEFVNWFSNLRTRLQNCIFIFYKFWKSK